jgi:hypothetical protein
MCIRKELGLNGCSNCAILHEAYNGCPSGMDVKIGNFTQSKLGDYSG